MGHETTQPSLLSRVRDASDGAAWREFDVKYRELILRYCRARGVSVTDAEDVRQIAMTNLAKSLRGFQYDRERGRFRSYLGQVVRSAMRRHFSRPETRHRTLDSVALAVTAGEDAADDVWEREWMRHHYRLAMATVRRGFERRSVEMFDRLLGGDAVAQIAKDYATSEQAVHKVKQRVRDRLKELIEVQIREEEVIDG